MKIILLADSDYKRETGLMFHQPIELDECAFFIFPRSGQHVFWNMNVDFPISLLFCDEDGVVKDIKTLEAQQKEAVKPKSFDIRYVIESHIDAPKHHKIEIGKRMKRDSNEVSFND